MKWINAMIVGNHGEKNMIHNSNIAIFELTE